MNTQNGKVDLGFQLSYLWKYEIKSLFILLFFECIDVIGAVNDGAFKVMIKYVSLQYKW